MIVPEQKVKVVWTGNNREYYENKGYIFSKYHDSFMVNADDLPLSVQKKVLVVCDICGEEKIIGYGKYRVNISVNGKYVCHKCSVQVRHDKELAFRQDKHVKKLIDVCNNHNYILLSSKEEIKKNTSIVRYACLKHGEQKMQVNNMINGKCCPKCAKDLARNKFQLSMSEVIKRVSDCGGEILNPDEYINTSECNLKFKCMNCGQIFQSSLQRFTQHGGQVCKKCSDNESFGEKKIRYYLEKHNINFEQEKWFPDCRDIKPLRFDFYLSELNIIIEFDGRQHFESTEYFKHSVDKIKNHDEIKNKYCSNNNIKLIRIPYTKIKYIDEILDKNLFT